MVQAIFNSDIIANFDISFCPKKDYGKFNSLTKEYNYYDFSYSDVKDCKEVVDDDYQGCCIIKQNDPNLTCENVFESKNHDLGMRYLFPEKDISYAVCHTEPVREYVDKFGFGPNKIINFFQLLLVAIVSLMITAIIACCYEFWLKYSDSIDCFYFKSNCKNIGAPRDGKEGVFSLADYMFPNRLWCYPYQICDNNNLSGGGKNTNNSFVSNYAEYNEQGVKCITIDDDNGSKKVFPYNIADYAHENLKPNSLLSMILKAFSFFFLFTVLMTRKVLHSFFSGISKKYNNNVKNNPIASNIIFLLLGNIGIVIFLGLIALLNGTFLNPGFAVIYSFFILITFNKLFKSSVDKCKHLIPGNLDYNDLYYNIYTFSNFYSMLYYIRPDKIFNNYRINYPDNRNVTAFAHTFWFFIINIFRNTFMIVIILLSIIISLGVGSASSLLATIYMNLSLLFNIIYIPLSNQIEFFDILKEHGNLLTVLFCVSIVGSSASSLDPVTTGIMSAILAIIILMKTIKGFKKYS